MADRITQEIIGAALEVHRLPGPGLLENIYKKALCHEFELRNIKYQCQEKVEIMYKDRLIAGQRLDLLVNNEVIVEIKSLTRIPEISMAQVLSYLKATNLKRGLIINFGTLRLKDGIKRLSL